MRFALGNSYNIPAVKQLALNGLDAMIATSSAMGIKTWTDKSRFGLSLTLGGGEVTMWDMSEAFGTFANAGVHVPLNPILKVETYDGKILEESKLEEITDLVSSLSENWETFWQNQDKKKCLTKNSQQSINDQHNELCANVALPEEVAYIISHILLDNNARVGAFGSSSKLVIPGKTVSVKTGTTNDLRDNWTVGYTREYLVATWVGNNDNTPMSRVTSGVTGAAPIWNTIMKYLLKDQKDTFPQQPQGVEFHDICTQTGLLPTPENPCETRSEIFIKGILPQNNIGTKKQIWVRRSDKYPLLPGDQTIDLDLEEHFVLSDPFSKDYCLDCAYPKDEKGNLIWPETIINYDNFQIIPPSPNNFLETSPTPT
jgi:membrane carboxypeptidase/penicillin-binding protein